jgi:hypothetical protein
MRRTLGTLLPALLLALAPCLAGCGSSSPGATADVDHLGQDSGQDSAAFTRVALISQSAAGGEVGHRATVLDSHAAVAAFARQFRTDALGHRIETAIRKADVPRDRTVVGQVVALGCDVPPGVEVHATGGRVAIEPKPVPSPLPECLVAETTVALVAVDADAVRG